MAALVVTLLIVLLPLLLWWLRIYQSKKNVAPGPLAIPLLGHLHLLGRHPHKALSILSKKFGSVMSINLGSVPTLVISSPDAAKTILSTQDIFFASRPRTAAAKFIFFNARDMVWCEYGSYWRTMKKVSTLELFTAKRVEESKKLRMEEISRLVTSIAREGDNGRVAIDMNAKLSMTNMNLVSFMAFSQRFEESSFVELLQEAIDLVTSFVPSDYFPYLSWMDDYLGTVPKMKAVQGKLDKIFQAIIDEHRRVNGEKQRAPDLVDVLLSLDEVDDNDRKGLIMDMFGAGIDTSSITTEWALSELIRNPACMLKAQREIDQAVGFDRAVNEDDLLNLGYVRAIAKETFRLHPPVPLLIPHESTQESLVNGLRVPARTRATVNVWSIGRDPRWWERPEVFDPDRFAARSVIDVKGQHFELLPFGSGRRMCPAMGLGLAMVELSLARLIQGFEWNLPAGLQELNMEEEFGVTLRKRVHLSALAMPRLKAELYV
ncbi:cytochrome P450 71A1-like [Selaginella moellendorffii]|uniref:Cytochrome P450-dependent monooxygenase n=1 Tax=Selaginella moellendorffii TaxID=88036 RepID=B2XCJ2_SELML|nr:cytochrome P450 71A1-like [Selaginella moellendorffii]ABV80351.1 cytochrome P450-dependent monooxygenase [Selaginella moellendorffii]|eukprot:XP_024544958.1 cytochrome P450 71A1-like [Selaginella moellendorffii]